ncbi:MAG: hypothetical protein ACE5HJ_07090 [Thermoplasmata archaeon]
MKAFWTWSPLPDVLRRTPIASVFGLAFVGAYLSTILVAAYTSLPANPWLGGEHGLLLRPEPVVIPAALLFGLPAIVGTSAGILIHNLLFRITPGGVTVAFSVAQTAVVAVGSYISLGLRNRVPRPFNNLVATWTISVFIIFLLGSFAALEYGTPVLHEWDHIFREVLLPINVFGLLILEVCDFLRGAKASDSMEES